MPDDQKDVQLNWLKKASDGELRRYVMNNNRRILDLNKLSLFLAENFSAEYDPRKGEVVDAAIRIMEGMQTKLEEAESRLDGINDSVSI